MRSALFAAALTLVSPLALPAAEKPGAAHAVNSLGLDLYREQIKAATGQGVLLSPYSISAALAMTYAGADGETREEMQRVLHFSAAPGPTSEAFHQLARQLTDVARASQERVAQLRADGGDETPLQLAVANRLFVQEGYTLRPAFTARLREHFDAAPVALDFQKKPAAARTHINGWVAEQTRDRIRDLLPVGQPPAETRVVLVNAVYLKAAWEDAFYERATQPEKFHFGSGTTAEVPMMRATRRLGYAKRDGYTIVTLPYQTGRLQFVLFVPDTVDGLSGLEQSLTADDLAACTHLDTAKVQLHLPRYKLAPGTLALATALQSLGLRTAFDQPRRSANFDAMAPRTPNDYLFIGDVFHQTWLSLDEHGTEAAAATAVVMLAALSAAPQPEPPPVEVRADRPFLFAIQHVESGACLFLGRVTDPRRE